MYIWIDWLSLLYQLNFEEDSTRSKGHISRKYNFKNLRQLLHGWLPCSFSDKDSAISTIKDVICILRTSRFCLHKWIANDREILRSLPVSEVSPKIVNLELDEIPIEKALGSLWNPLNYLLQIKAINKTLPTSKRAFSVLLALYLAPLECWLQPHSNPN